MEYLVLMKHVPKFTRVQLDPITHNLLRDGMRMIINPADLNALTLAIQLKRKTGGRITILTMGPERSADMVKEAIAMGADRGYVLSGGAFRGSDTLATSYALSSAIKYIGEFDVILAGTQTIDGDTGQVGPEVAEFLGINQATYLKDASYKDGKFEVLRELSSSVEKQRVSTPVLFTVIREANEVKKVSKEKIESISDSLINIISDEDVGMNKEQLGVSGSPTVVKEVFAYQNRATGLLLEGSIEEQVNKLVEVLKADGIIGR
ncbi:MAG: electron transfer flavoprotein subunit beta/FixA family protein [Peptoniphilus sp.]|uniref:electron transfer flavoprotein subunit beta/FixA family protein n=1 Tax=Peptoniphilus sp. TaxID=1971214 RepID=UPI002A75B57F|nr:electron transfer flavoprotein subunit beta/FixA family protein [Peptoniphilus sp.]MDY2986493.1 electron transfer flavoprotein subunit beta/FixA family protein [Peptoniphilus sp.]